MRFMEDGGAERRLTVSKDEGVRPGTTLPGLSKLRPAFKPGGSTTAGQNPTRTSEPVSVSSC